MLAVLGWLILLPQPAWADLMLHPTRVVFQKNQRTAQLDLINNGTEPATYRISVVNRRMSESGEFLTVDTPEAGEQFADRMLHFSPRQITLMAGTSQTVRIMVRRPANLAPGEYRSHLQFEKLPQAGGATSVESQDKNDQQIGIVLTALIGASIPVIVRHDVTAATVSLSHLELQTEAATRQPVLSLQFDRSGNSSVYGDLTVSFTPQGGAEQLIAAANGLAVYTPNPVRRTRLALRPPPGLALTRGTLRATYRDRPEAGGKLLAQAAIVLP